MATVSFVQNNNMTVINNVIIFPENTTEISINWNLKDLENKNDFKLIDYYWVGLESSDGSIVYTYAKNVRDTSINFNVADYAGRYDDGYSFRFIVYAFDNYGRRSSGVASTYTFKFNTFRDNGVTVRIGSTITYSTSNYNLSLNLSGNPKNTNNNGTFFKEISASMKIDPYYYCEIHNPQYALTNNRIVVVGINGTPPTNEAYITLKEIRENMSSLTNNSTGYITVTLTNNWGSTVTISGSTPINLPYMPASASGITVQRNKTVSGTGYYMSGYPVTINFTAGKDQYGIKEPTHYFHYAIVDVGTSAPDDSQYRCIYAYNGVQLNVPAQNKQKLMYYKVETRLNNISTFTGVSSLTLDYYNRPSVTITNINRDETQLTFKVEISKNSSIPEGTLKITSVKYNNKNNTSYAMTKDTTTTNTHTTWNASLNITKEDKWLMIVKVHDSFCGTNDPTIRTTQIHAYIPVMTFTKYGVGISHIPEYRDKNYKLTVGGVSQFKENTHFFNGVSIHKKLDLYDLYPERGDLILNSYDDYLAALYGGRLNTDTKIRFFNQDSSTNNSYDYSADIYVNGDRLAIDYTDVSGGRVTEQFVTFNDLVTNSTSSYVAKGNYTNSINGMKREVIVIKTGSYYYKTCTIKVPISHFGSTNVTNVFELVSGSDPNSKYVYYLNPNVHTYRNGNSYGYIKAIFKSDMLPVVTATVESDDGNIFYTLKLKQDGTAYKIPSIMVHANKLDNPGAPCNYGFINIVAQGRCELIDTTTTYEDTVCSGTIIPNSYTLYYVNPSAYVKDTYGV